MQAASMLGVSPNVIRVAARDGRFTTIPATGQKQYIPEEQVRLFVGKKRISVQALPDTERTLWEQYKIEAQGHGVTDTERAGYTVEDIKNLPTPAKDLLLLTLLGMAGVGTTFFGVARSYQG